MPVKAIVSALLSDRDRLDPHGSPEDFGFLVQVLVGAELSIPPLAGHLE
jgi:hypothetical protein